MFPPSLTDDQVREIRRSDLPTRDLAEKLGVSVEVAHGVRINKTYRRVPWETGTRPRKKGPCRGRISHTLLRLNVGESVLFRGKTRDNISVAYWQRKTGRRFSRRSTNHGVRVTRIA